MVLSLRHDQTGIAGATVMRFFSCDLPQSKEAFDSEVALCRQDGRDYLTVYLMQCHPSRGTAPMLDGAGLLEKWEAQQQGLT